MCPTSLRKYIRHENIVTVKFDENCRINAINLFKANLLIRRVNKTYFFINIGDSSCIEATSFWKLQLDNSVSTFEKIYLLQLF